MTHIELNPKLRNKYDSPSLKSEKQIITEPENRHCLNCKWYNKGTSPNASYHGCHNTTSKFYKRETFARDSCEFWQQWNVKT